ncbi:hypothetical protein K458DRAFT_428742 [Lentithecium fluviatile CBS 122367]|uniref:Uncharacterized protein n=1 Tax=Lentithecium fluviatile CBS 122367 TaxID=1168545 RepID=A0A6G1JCT3_9PLEO|nr:hypothetical protein K458DRAFT_428742 [Lentithecium fluviatile CBS 122367]
MVFNVLDPAQTRYIVNEEDLESFLKEKYGKEHPDFDYNIEHVCDRWTFEAPEQVEEDEIRRLIDDIEKRVKEKT